MERHPEAKSIQSAPCFFKIHFNVNFPSTPWFPQCSLPFINLDVRLYLNGRHEMLVASTAWGTQNRGALPPLFILNSYFGRNIYVMWFHSTLVFTSERVDVVRPCSNALPLPPLRMRPRVCEKTNKIADCKKILRYSSIHSPYKDDVANTFIFIRGVTRCFHVSGVEPWATPGTSLCRISESTVLPVSLKQISCLCVYPLLRGTPITRVTSFLVCIWDWNYVILRSRARNQKCGHLTWCSFGRTSIPGGPDACLCDDQEMWFRFHSL